MTVQRNLFIDISNSHNLNNVANELMARTSLTLLDQDTGHRELFLRDVLHKTLLIFAIAKGYNHTSASIFAEKNDTQSTVIDALLKHPDLHNMINLQDERGNTALHLACIHHDAALMQRLLEYQADPTLQNKEGRTPKEMIEQISYLQANILLGEYTGSSYCQLGITHTFTLQNEKKWMASKALCLDKLPSSHASEPSPDRIAQERRLSYLAWTQTIPSISIPHCALSTFIQKYSPRLSCPNFFRYELTPALPVLQKLLLTKQPNESFTVAEILATIGLACKSRKQVTIAKNYAIVFACRSGQFVTDVGNQEKLKPDESFFFSLGKMLKEQVDNHFDYSVDRQSGLIQALQILNRGPDDVSTLRTVR